MLDKQIQKILIRKPLLDPPAVYVADTGSEMGRGVYARKHFSAGDVVEISLVILLDYPHKDLPLPVQHLVFNWSKLCDAEEKFALALGYGGIYNHADQPNLRYSADPENQTMIYSAVREIKMGEQLTVSYNQVAEGAEPRKKSWFLSNKVEKIDIR
jgi:hypothetical protein